MATNLQRQYQLVRRLAIRDESAWIAAVKAPPASRGGGDKKRHLPAGGTKAPLSYRRIAQIGISAMLPSG